MSSNVYLLRNIKSGKIFISRQFQFTDPQPSNLQKVLRRDHWVPFCIATSLTKPQADAVFARLHSKTNQINAMPEPPGETQIIYGHVRRMPVKWQPSPQVLACSHEVREAVRDAGDVELHWERPEYHSAVRDWPVRVRNKQLKLVRNRYPLVSGLDHRTWTDLDQKVV